MDDWIELNGYEMAELNLPVGTQYQWWCSFRGSWFWEEVCGRKSGSYERLCRISTADFNRAQAALGKAEQEETVTIAKMTEGEAEALWMFSDGTKRTFVDRLRQLGLIKATPIETEREICFRVQHRIEITPAIKLALEFDR